MRLLIFDILIKLNTEKNMSEVCFRHATTGQMLVGRYGFGYALNSQLGLVMVGGFNVAGNALPSESTTDGINVDSNAVAGFGDFIYANCLVNVNDTTLISFGGVPSDNNGRRIAVHTIGNSAWEVGTSM